MPDNDDTTTTAEPTTEEQEDTEAEALLADSAADDEGDSGGDGDQQAGGDSGGETAPKAERKTVDQAEFVKVVKERQAARKQLKDMQKQLDDLKRANEDENERAQREAAEKAAADIESKYKPIVVHTSAKAALVGAGVAEDKVGRLIKLMDLEEIRIGDDNTVEGVTEQVAQLQEDYPELFAAPEPEKPKPRTARAADGADKPAAKPKPTTAELIAQGLRGGR